jgi:hypothetical protein
VARHRGRPDPALPLRRGPGHRGHRLVPPGQAGKRIWSRGLRLLAIVPVTAGGLQPLLDAAPRAQPHRLGLRAAGPGRRLEQLQYDWAAECARSASRAVDPKQVQNRLALLRAFSDDVAALLQQETAEWVLAFQSNLLRLERSNASRPGSVPLHGTAEP